MASSSSAERYRLRDAFYAVRARVLDQVPAQALTRAVAYWALSADRRLPVALLDRNLGEILETPFERLAATPGIGLKKMAMLNMLLRRAADHAGSVDSFSFSDYGEPPFQDWRTMAGATVEPLISGASNVLTDANSVVPQTPTTGANLPSGTLEQASVTQVAKPVRGEFSAARSQDLGSSDGINSEFGTHDSSTADVGSPHLGRSGKNISGQLASTVPSTPSSPTAALQSGASRGAASATSADIDPNYVSETLWASWRATVRRNELEHECLGRFAPSLHGVPTVIWDAPLGDYTPVSLSELRKRKTHGDKRVRVILQVFRGLHEALGENAASGRFALRPLPRFILPIESWLRTVARAVAPVGWAEVRSGLALPLINQVAVDAGALIAKLVESRLGVEGTAETVVEQSRRLGLTRARVYQLLETCAAIMAVRWPEGRLHFAILQENSHRVFLDPESRRLFEACFGLCFPPESERRPNGRRMARRPTDAPQCSGIDSDIATVGDQTVR
ncbi:MAG: hypothetical protein ACKO38_13850 [Planctomycetota bacterium]